MISRSGSVAALILLLFAVAVTPVMAGNSVEQAAEAFSLSQPGDESDGEADFDADLPAILSMYSAAGRCVAEHHLKCSVGAPLPGAALYRYSRAPPLS